MAAESLAWQLSSEAKPSRRLLARATVLGSDALRAATAFGARAGSLSAPP